LMFGFSKEEVIKIAIAMGVGLLIPLLCFVMMWLQVGW